MAFQISRDTREVSEMTIARSQSDSSMTTTFGDLLTRARVETVGRLPKFAIDATLSGITYDSRAVEPGALFFALKGENFNGLDFVGEAQRRGAGGVISESGRPSDVHIPWVVVRDARAALASLSAEFYLNPSDKLSVIGTTGTNGKTTTTYLIESIFEHAGIPTGRMSSVAHRVSSRLEERLSERTTPESSDIQKMLSLMRENDVQVCVMEVSSHALALRRVDHVKFAAAVFTNLTHDHLDFHRTMESYFAAKRGLFTSLINNAPAIINNDDEYGKKLLSDVRRPLTYGIENKSDVSVRRLKLSRDGISIEVDTPRGALELSSPLLGKSNAYNVMAAVATGVALDVPFAEIEQGVRGLSSVPGRMEVVSTLSDDITVVVDFAHTDDALRGLLETVRPLCTGKLVTVFGCGGNRDASKRPLMGAVSEKLSDRTVVTSDNPRFEDPLAIIADIQSGCSRSNSTWSVVVDRKEAIAKSIRDAGEGDFVVVAGKGHERHQVFGNRQLPFEDVSIARAALAWRRNGPNIEQSKGN